MLTKLKAETYRGTLEQTTFFLQNGNNRSHTDCKTYGAHCQSRLDCSMHPVYSPDLVLSDFHLFRLITDGLHGQHFPSNNVVVTVTQWVIFAGVDFFLLFFYFFLHKPGTQVLALCWEKCVAKDGDYIEK